MHSCAQIIPEPPAPERPYLRPVDAVPPAAADAMDPGILAALTTASGVEIADLARAALAPLLRHDAVVLVTSASAGLPVRIAAPRGLRESLAAVDWRRAVEHGTAADGTATGLQLPDLDGGLKLAGWVASSGGVTVSLVVLARARLEIEPAAERAATLVALLAAGRTCRVDHDPPPGTLAFSRAMSQERERVRAELNSRHAATLSGILLTLRGATRAGGSRSAQPAVSEAIDLASHALLDLEAFNALHDQADRVLLQRAFQQTQNEVRGVAHAARLRVLADLDAREEHQVPRAIAQAARLMTVGAALRAARRPGGDKLRVLWRLCSTTLTVTVADNGEELAGGESSAMLAELERRIGGLGAEIELDSKPYWGTTLTCRLPLHDSPAWPETPAVKRLAELRERELEVLELMIAGLRNRDIADRLFISVRTVKFHVSNVLRKLEVDSRTAAIALAHGAGITAPTTVEADAASASAPAPARAMATAVRGTP